MKQRKQKFNSMVRFFGIIGLILFAIFGGVAAVGCILAVAPLAWLSEKGEFKELAKEDLEKLSAEDLAGYFNAFNAAKWKAIEDKISAKAENKEVSELQKQFTENLNIQMKSLNDILIKQGLEIVKLKSLNSPKKESSLKDLLISKKDDFQKVLAKEQQNVSFGMKVKELLFKDSAAVMAITDATGGDFPQAFRESGITPLVRKQPFMRQLIDVRTLAGTMIVEWVEQASKTGGVTAVAEGIEKPQYSYKVIVRRESLKKRAVWIETTDEMLRFPANMEAEIKGDLVAEMEGDLDDQILNGDNENLNLNGIIEQSTAWAAGTFAGKIPLANYWDVLKSAVAQVNKASKKKYSATTIMVGVDTEAMLHMASKTSEGIYLYPSFVSPDGKYVSGVPIVTNTDIAEGKFLVFDGKKAVLYIAEDTTVTVGLKGNDFIENIKTILAEIYCLLRIKTNEKSAFVYGDLDTAVAILDNGSTPS